MQVLGASCVLTLWLTLLSGCTPVAGRARKPPLDDRSALVETIPLRGSPTAIAVTPDGMRAYVTALEKMFVVDTGNGAVVDTVTLPGPAADIALTADGAHVHVAQARAESLWVIDTANNQIAARIDLGAGKAATATPALARNGDGSIVYLTDPGNDTLLVVDTVESFVRTRIGLHMHPTGVALRPDGRAVYVSGCVDPCTSGMIAIVDTRTFVITDSVPTAHALWHVAVNPNGKFAYASSASEVLVLDAGTNDVVAVIPGELGSEVNVTSDGALAYVHGSWLLVIDAGRNVATATVPLPAGVTSFALSPDASLAYFTGPGGLYVIDIRTRGAGSR